MTVLQVFLMFDLMSTWFLLTSDKRQTYTTCSFLFENFFKTLFLILNKGGGGRESESNIYMCNILIKIYLFYRSVDAVSLLSYDFYSVISTDSAVHTSALYASNVTKGSDGKKNVVSDF